jgi:hypothetical protein
MLQHGSALTAIIVVSAVLAALNNVCDADTSVTAADSSMTDASVDSTRYGLFNALDHRSRYGQFWFVEPLRGPEMDVDREFRVDWFHGEDQNLQQDEVEAEIEYNFGLLTLELELPYEREAELSADGREVAEGIGNIELSARHPIFQAVSEDGKLDYTIVAALELALPTQSEISHDTEIVPQIFQLLRVGEHLSIEASAGESFLIGPDEGGASAFEYDLVFGYNLEHEELPIPGVERTIPIFELNGERVTNGADGDDDSDNELFGTIGARFNLTPVAGLQPRVGFGYVFPIDQGARESLDWGVITSLVFEF